MSFGNILDPSEPVQNIGQMRWFTHEGHKMFHYLHEHGFDCNWEDGHIAPIRAFNNCAALRSVVSRNAQSMSNGSWYILDKNDITGNDISGRFRNATKLLEQPNEEQEWKEFIIQCEVYRQLFGEVYIYGSGPEGMSNQYIDSLWVLSPKEIQFKYDSDYIEICFEDKRIEVHKDRICHIKDTGKFPCPINKWHHFKWEDEHKSRVHAARFAIKNIIQAEEAIYSINHDRGALGAWVDDSDSPGIKTSISPKEEDDLLNRLKNAFGIVRNKFKMMVIRHRMKWVPMGMNVKDLMLIEGMNKNLETICNAFDYPMELLISNAKYTNKEVAKGYYDDAVIPFSLIYAAKLRHFLLNNEAYFVVDFSHVPAMKVAEEQKAKVYLQKTTAVQKLYQDGVISREEARLELGYEESIEGKTMYNIQENGGTNTGAN